MRADRISSRRFPLLVVGALGVLGLSGCGLGTYSDAVRYLVRTDPVIANEKIGDERPQADQPGRMPIMSMTDLLEIPGLNYQSPGDLKKYFSAEQIIDPTLISDKDRDTLQNELDAIFGTPGDPHVKGIKKETREKLKLDDETLKKGSKYYRLHCLHCHGVTGNGRGPTAHWVNPHPRDYRRGLFKFQSVDQVSDNLIRKPSRADLHRVLEQGIEGTAMPSFGLLSHNDLEYLVSYVIHLSIRGEAEYQVFIEAFQYSNGVFKGKTPLKSAVRQMVKNKVGEWLESQDRPIKPVAYKYTEDMMKDSVRRGHALYLGEEDKLIEVFPEADPKKDPEKKILNAVKGAGCGACHIDFGRRVNFKFDQWGTFVRPADLTRGVYRGGHRPIDLYYRVHSGINGSGMASFGKTLLAKELLETPTYKGKNYTPIWDVINFIRVLPYPAMREKYGIQIN